MQADLEAHVGSVVKRATLADFETGRRLPSLRTLIAIADAFEVSVARLVLDPQTETAAIKALDGA